MYDLKDTAFYTDLFFRLVTGLVAQWIATVTQIVR
jgi:hypothetical protein